MFRSSHDRPEMDLRLMAKDGLAQPGQSLVERCTVALATVPSADGMIFTIQVTSVSSVLRARCSKDA